jgi:hypothetical protein
MIEDGFKLQPHEPDVLRQLRALTLDEYEQVLTLISSFKQAPSIYADKTIRHGLNKPTEGAANV